MSKSPRSLEPPRALSVVPRIGYDEWHGQSRLYDPAELPLDVDIRSILAQYREATSTQRESWRQSIDEQAGYTLLTFSRRAAVFGMRRDDARTVADGLSACAVIDAVRVDERDILLALAMLHHAAHRIGEDPDAMLRQASAEAVPQVANLIRGLLARPAPERDLRDAWGYVEVAAPGGVGLLPWGFRPWMPTLDLATAGVRIAALISAGDYQADDPMLAVEMPEIWLSDAADPSLGPILGSARGALVVQGRLRPTVSAEHSSQQLTIWVVEAPDGAMARRLQVMSQHGRTGAALLGVAEGPLFALVMGRSFVRGVPSYETAASLARFAAPLSEALASADEISGQAESGAR